MFLQILVSLSVIFTCFIGFKSIKHYIDHRKWLKEEKEFNKKYIEWFNSQEKSFQRSERFIKKWGGLYGKYIIIARPFEWRYSSEFRAKEFPTKYYHYYDGEIVHKYMVESRLQNSYTHRSKQVNKEFPVGVE